VNLSGCTDAEPDQSTALCIEAMELNASPLRWDNERGFGVVYLLVTALGFVAPALTASLLAINPADNFLHLVLGIVLAGVGFGVPSKAMA
jgi:glucose uptake protein GlcU